MLREDGRLVILGVEKKEFVLTALVGSRRHEDSVGIARVATVVG